MAELTLKDGKTKIVSYNTAAKIYNIQKGAVIKAEPKELAQLKKIAAQTTRIDFKKVAK